MRVLNMSDPIPNRDLPDMIQCCEAFLSRKKMSCPLHPIFKPDESKSFLLSSERRRKSLRSMYQVEKIRLSRYKRNTPKHLPSFAPSN